MEAVLEPIQRVNKSSNRRHSLLVMGLILIVFLVGFGAVAWRLDKAPDIFTDEIIYTRIGLRVSGEGALVWDSGEPFLVHPPLNFLVHGAYFWFTDEANTPIYAAGDIFSQVHQARILNAIFAGLTAVILFLIGRRLRGLWLGLLMAVLFSLDPFGVRINRRAMLETLAVMLSLIGMGLLLVENKKGHLSWLMAGVAAGMTFGLALLTKELTFINVLAVLTCGLWQGWRSLRRRIFSPREVMAPFVTAGVAALTYGIYPLWIFMNGLWEPFAEEKILALKRLLGLVQLTGWNRPEVSLLTFISQRLEDYGSSYLLLALGGIATIWLLLRHRNTQTGRLLGVWGAVLYPFFGFITLFGSGNDQFFYLLLVPAIVLSCYAFNAPRLAGVNDSPSRRWESTWSGISKATTGLLVLVFLPFNLLHWYTHYGSGEDQGYQKLTAFVQTQIPVDEPLNASGDPIKFLYFLPEHTITAAATPDEAMEQGIHYYVLAPKDVWAQYGRIKAELADWITAEGERIFATSGDSYGDIYVYQVDYETQATNPNPVAEENSGARWRSFQPAKGAFIDSLTLILSLWIAFLHMLAVVSLMGQQFLRVENKDDPRFQSFKTPEQSHMESQHEHA